MFRPDAPTTWPLAKAKTAAGKKATELYGDWVDQFARIEKVEGEYAKAQADVKAAEEGIRSAENAQAAADAEKAYVAAKDALDGPWQARIQGPARSCHNAEHALRQFVTDNLVEVLSEPELADAAEAAREAVVAGAEAVDAAFAEWTRAEAANRAVVRLVDGIDARCIPTMSASANALAGSARQMVEAEASEPRIGTNALQAPVPVLPDEVTG